MKWSINELYQYQSKGLEIDETINLDELKNEHDELRGVEPVHVSGRADITSSKAAFHLIIEGVMILPCARTLVDVRYPFKIDTTEIYLLKPTDYVDEEEPEIHQLEGDSVDLIPVIKELILLEIPIQVFSDNVNEEGAAPQEGKDWQVISEEESKAKVDPRLADLAKFFDNNKKS
ncbi:YceD family protein [Metabacillus sp. RGM 3146]|uniref:YceD family protein n=1 Tax=Metabacillus sp. RGM 3146 TaxID=3401092 RepID=UPI003B9A0818